MNWIKWSKGVIKNNKKINSLEDLENIYFRRILGGYLENIIDSMSWQIQKVMSKSKPINVANNIVPFQTKKSPFLVGI